MVQKEMSDNNLSRQGLEYDTGEMVIWPPFRAKITPTPKIGETPCDSMYWVYIKVLQWAVITNIRYWSV